MKREEAIKRLEILNDALAEQNINADGNING